MWAPPIGVILNQLSTFLHLSISKGNNSTPVAEFIDPVREIKPALKWGRTTFNPRTPFNSRT